MHLPQSAQSTFCWSSAAAADSSTIPTNATTTTSYADAGATTTTDDDDASVFSASWHQCSEPITISATTTTAATYRTWCSVSASASL